MRTLLGEAASWADSARIEKFYEPLSEAGNTDMPTLVKPPEDLVGWLQDHPYFELEGLEPITVGGIEGQQCDIVVDVPKVISAGVGRTA